MLIVARTDGSTEEFDKQRIVNAILEETWLCEEIFGCPSATDEEAHRIAWQVESLVKGMKQRFVTSHTIRELMCSIMLSDMELPGYSEKWYAVCTRVGMPVYDAWQIDQGEGFESHDNANLKGNAETSHKKKADKLSKEQNLLLIPPELAVLHNRGDLHIHDLEYFSNRPFCCDSDLRYLFYYGLTPSGDSATSAIAKPAKNAEVAILHAVKWLGSAQTNFAGGQGFYNFLTFLAPYLEDKSYEEIYQLMQMFVYEMMQMYCARGGQVVFSSVQLSPGVPKIWRDKPSVYRGEIHPDLPYYYFEREARLAFLALMDVMLKGDAQGKPFSFPKPEIALEPCFVEPDDLMKHYDVRHPDQPTYDELYKKAFELAAKFGTPYFDNMLPPYRGSGTGISCYQCVPEFETVYVRTESGRKIVPISEVGWDDEILTPSGFSSFWEIMSQEFHGDLNKVTLTGGRTVYMTDDHELKVFRDGREVKIRAEDLVRSDKLKVSTELATHGSAIQRAVEIFGVDPKDINDFAYFMGLYCAEGNVLIRPSKIGGHRLQISLNLKTERDYCNRIVDILQRVFKVNPIVKEIRENELRILVYSKEFCLKFRDTGIQEKSGSGWIPEFMFSASPEAKWQFIHGYFDGDGTYSYVRQYPRITLYSKSDDIIYGLSYLLQSIGIHSAITRSSRDLSQLNIATSEGLERFKSYPVASTDPFTLYGIRSIEKVPYDGKVYDPVNVKGHEFITGQGIIIGNCCAYQFSNTIKDDPEFEDKLLFKDGKHFSMGSWMVVTLNCVRCAYDAKIAYIEGCSNIERDYICNLKSRMYQATEIFRVKHDRMQKLIENGRIPFALQTPKDPNDPSKTAPPAIDLESYVYTIGVIGIDDAVFVLTGKHMDEDRESLQLGLQIIKKMKDYLEYLSEMTGLKLALARTPAETTGQRFAVCDLRDKWYKTMAMKTVHGDLGYALDHLSESDLPIYYSNGTHLSVDSAASLFDKIRIESKFFPILDGGNILHIWVGERHPDPDALYEFGMNVAKNTQAGYFAFTKDFTVCSACNSTVPGICDTCEKCGSDDVDYISRITGYLSNVSGWNAGKRQELKDRTRVIL